jgi:tape measure domain-containing protein
MAAELSIVISAKNQASSALKSVAADVANVGKTAQTVQQQMKGMGEAMQGLGGKLTLGVTTPILGFAAAAIKGAADAEQLQVAFATMLGGADKATKLLGEITKFAASTPFETTEIANASKQLLAFGFAQEQVIPTMTQLGDLASGLGIPLGDLAYLYGTARAQGRLFAADINQFSSRGVPILKSLAKVLGVSEQEVKKLVEAGKVGFPELEKAMALMTQEGSQFGGMMAAQSSTFNGLMSTLKDNIALTMTEIGKAIIEGFDLKGALNDFIAFTERIKIFVLDLAKTNPQLFKMGLIFAAIAAAVGPALVGLGTLLTVLAPLAPAFAVLTGPIGLVVLGLGALAAFNWGSITAGVERAAFVWNNYRDAVLDAGYGTTESQESINLFPPILQGIARAVDRVAGAFQDGKTSISGVMGELVAQFTGLGLETFDTTDNIREMVLALTGSKTTMESVSAAVLGIGVALRAVIVAISDFITTGNTEGLKAVFASIKDGIADIELPDISDVWKSAKIKITTIVHDIDWQVPADTFGKLKTSVVAAIASVDWSLTSFARGEGTTGGIAANVGKLKNGIVDAIAGIDWTATEATLGVLKTKAVALKDSIVGAITEINWGELAQDKLALLNTGITTLKDAIIGAIVGVKWEVNPEQLTTLQGVLDGVKPIIDGIFGSDGILATIATSINEVITSVGDKLASIDALALGEQVSGIFLALAGMATTIAVADIEGSAARISSIVGLGNDVLLFLTNFGAGIDAEAIGTALGTFVSGIGETLSEKFTDPELINLGTSAGAFVGLIATKIGEALSSPTFGQDVGTGVGQAASGFAVAAGKVIANFANELAAVDWAQFQGNLFTFVNGLLSGLVTGLADQDWSIIGMSVKDGIIKAITAELSKPFEVNIIKGGFLDKLFSGVDLGGLHKEDPLRDAKSMGFKWEAFIPQLLWSDWIGEILQWASWIGSVLQWSTFIPSALLWSAFVKNLAWSIWIDDLDWGIFIPDINWASFISSAPKSVSELVTGVPDPTNQAIGTSNWRGGAVTVGETGPETVWLPRGSRIFSNQESMTMAGAGAINVTVNAEVSSGIDMEQLAYKVVDKIRHMRGTR